MKTKSVLSLFAVLLTGTLLAQTSGGPDTYGYTWKNQADANGPVYNFIDIKNIGTQITGLGDDNSVGTFNLNWDFHYYWNDYNKVLVGSNGWISFTPLGNIASPFPTIPSAAAPNNYIAGMLSDLTFTNSSNQQVPGTTAWYWSNNVDTLIVQYDSVPFWANTGQKFAGRNTFQIILSGIDSSITFQYRYQNGLTNNTDIKSGIENLTGQIGLQVLSSAYPTANSAVKFYYPNPVTYQVFDATPAWNHNAENGGFFLSANGAPQNLTTDIENVGNQAITNIVTTGEVLNSSSVQVWDTTATVYSLAAGVDSMLAYPKTFSATTPGTYIYRSTATLSGDMNPGNDAINVELVVVDTTQPVITLGYTEATTAAGSLNWSGGGINDGAGVYIVPPFYPASISSVDCYIANGTTGGFTTEIRDDNGTNGAPGATLSSDTVQTGTVGAYNNVPMTQPVIVTSGGIYVSWLMYPDTTCGIGIDNTAPFSLRNYEIIGGAWATYRSNSAGDIMIRANITKYNFGTITATTSPDACPSNASGTATVSVTAGTSPPYTYLWSAGAQTTAVATGLAAGNHTVTITDSLGIINTSVVKVYNNIAVAAVSTASVSCFGGSNGQSTATIGGTAPYTYLWSNGQTDQIATGLTVGVYTVTASNTDGCMNIAVDTIDGPTAIANSFTVTPETCVGGDGTSTATVTGGTAPYTYLWNNLQTTATATGLVAGSYTIGVTDANSCTFTAATTITNTPFVVSTTSVVPANCSGGGGAATAVATSGGTTPYSYLWSNGQTDQTATGLSGGSYSVTITDAVGCTKSAAATITIVPFVTSSVSTPEKCFGSADGIANSVVSSGGTPPYTYAWTPSGQNTQIATGLTAGTYTIVTTDAVGCSSTKTVTVTSPTAIVINTTAQQATWPSFSNGSATANVSGGSTPYTYAWTPGGANSATITGLSAGNYTVCVTDVFGCSACDTVNVILNSINEIYTGATVDISPNPFSSSARVKIDFVNPTHDNLIFTLFDIYGRAIQSIDLNDYKGASIDFTLNRGYEIQGGMYFYRVEDKSGILAAGKLLVQ